MGALLLIWLGVHGQLAGFLALHLRLSDAAIYAALPTNLVQDVNDYLRLTFLALAVAPVLIALGLLERLRSQGKSTCADAILGLGLVAFVMSQKHIIRDISPDFLLICVVGLLAYVLLWRGHRTWLEYLCGAMIAGAFLFFMTEVGSAAAVAQTLKTSPHRIADSFHLLRREKPLLEAANAVRYAPERFALFRDELKVQAWVRQNNAGVSPQVFAITDNPILYVLTGQGPVYHSSLYNASPLYEQREVVSWLAAAKPQYATLDPAMTVFDGVPNAVRCPLIFAAVVETYVPEQVVGRIHILRRRLPGESIPLPYWRDKLGGIFDLGHLPRVSSFARFAPCHAESGRGCVDFLRVRLVKERAEAKIVAIPIEAEGLPFTLQFQTIPSQDTYYVLLDRVWFWKTVKDHGGAQRIAEAKVADGIELQLISREDLRDVLY